MADVECPQEGCPKVMNTHSKVFYSLPQQSKDKYKKTELWKQTINNPDLKLCPTENCEGLINTAKGKF